MTLVGLAGVVLVSTGIAWFSTGAMIPMLRRQGVIDVPNDRSSHVVPTPRGGGIGLLAGVAAGIGLGMLLGAPLPGWGFWVGSGLVAVAGWRDDHSGGLPILVRLLIQFVGAAIALFGTIEGFGPWALALVWVVGVTNIYNFLDGIDGYAGTQGVIAGVAVLAMADAGAPGIVGAAIAGGCLGFLVYNWHPARVFMGDVGSGALGFMLAALPFHGRGLPAVEGLFVIVAALWFFLADGTYTLCRRALRGERVWQAHRSHLYQRLVGAGLRHDQVVLRIMAPATVVAGLGVWSVHAHSIVGRWVTLGLAVILFGRLVALTRKQEQSRD